MTITHGFKLERDEKIEEINTRARIWRHVKTGAEYLSLENDDDNKVFNIAFRTPPNDSTGVAHIMEHAVLGGSRKYQVKEPFIELVKGSLNTFLNAMTFPAMTVYPVASTNLQDYYNLVDVYLDAVFHPLITPYHLQQEGWHYELDGVDDSLIFKGVVFNEMKGAYSSPENMLHRYSMQSLFPDTAYQHDSGGNPAAIPDLTYEQFKLFHETYYHPSNGLICMYGDDDPDERLRLLDVYLQEFEQADVSGMVTEQPTFAKPGQARFSYNVATEQTGEQTPKSFVRMNWALPEYESAEQKLALTILSDALVSSAASPLRKALLDSGLGEGVIGGGLSPYTRQMMFSVGLRGVESGKTAEVESLILKTLIELAEEGLEDEMVEAAVNTLEFGMRENNTGSFPRGLNVMFSALLNTWLYDKDPLDSLRYERPLTAVKQRIAEDDQYLQNLIGKHLLDNAHRMTVTLEPDSELAQRQEAAEKERLAQTREQMNGSDLQDTIDNTQELRRIQETPDSAEALAALPMLTLNDLDKEIKRTPLAISELQGSSVLYHDLFTNGIVYFDLGLNLRTLPQELLPYVSLFGRSLKGLGTETEDFVKLSQRIGRKTGGIGSGTFVSAQRKNPDGTSWLMLHGKATVNQGQDLLDILRDMLLTVNLDNRDRFRQLVLESKAGKEAGLVPSGHAVVNGRLRAQFNQADWAAEQIGGIEQLFFLRRLAERVENEWPAVLAELEQVRQHLINRQNMICNVTLDGQNYAKFEPQLDDFLAAMPSKSVEKQMWSGTAASTGSGQAVTKYEGLTIPAQVNYVAKGANLYDLGYELSGSIMVISNLLGTTHLWDKIRVQGGAYGGFSTFSGQSGVFSYLSYRDPNLLGTLANYDTTADFLRNLTLNDDELTKNIIGAIGSLDSYQLPDARGLSSMYQYLIGTSDADRQERRDEVLSTTIEDFRALADLLEKINEIGSVVVMGSSEAISAANKERDDWLTVTQVL